MSAYSTAHSAVEIEFGKASDYSCVDCGKPAQEWAFNGKEPRVQGKNGLWFSTDINNYDPKCRPCHRGKDYSRTHCPKKHEYTEGNTYWKTSRTGTRVKVCRTCQLTWQRQHADE